MKKLYSVDDHQDTRKVRPEIVTLAVFLLLTILGGAFIFYDLSRNKTVINEVQNEPVLGVVESREDDYKTIETDYYSLDVPSNWTDGSQENVIVRGARYFPQSYQGTVGDDAGRSLQVYRSDIPALLPVSKILTVSISGNRILPSSTSPRCISFTEFDEPDGLSVPGRWNDIDFTCRTSNVANIIAALEGDQADGLKFMTNSGEQSYLLVYTDHGSDQNESIFYEILRSFRAK